MQKNDSLCPWREVRQAHESAGLGVRCGIGSKAVAGEQRCQCGNADGDSGCASPEELPARSFASGGRAVASLKAKSIRARSDLPPLRNARWASAREAST